MHKVREAYIKTAFDLVSKKSMGIEETRCWLRHKVDIPELSNRELEEALFLAQKGVAYDKIFGEIEKHFANRNLRLEAKRAKKVKHFRRKNTKPKVKVLNTAPGVDRTRDMFDPDAMGGGNL